MSNLWPLERHYIFGEAVVILGLVPSQHVEVILHVI